MLPFNEASPSLGSSRLGEGIGGAGQDDVDMAAAAHLLGSFRQHVQQHSPLGLGDQVGQASPDIFCGRSPRVSLPSQSQETLLDPARRPGAFIKSAFRPGDLSLPRAGQLRIPQRASPPREVSPSSSDLKHSSSELEADSGAVSQDEDQASPWAMPASTKQGATCAQLSTPLAEAACSPRLRRRQPAEWRTSPSTPEAPGTHRFGASTPTRKRRYSSQQPTSEGQQEAGSADGLRPRALFSAESGELGPTQARATKSASISRESLPASGPSRMRPGRMNQASSILHPILQMGWVPLCEVHCNGLTGLFLGGHDRDLYIRATSKDFVALPPTDYSQGGCILSCSQFEKCAGRELSKKWKESIHVHGEGEGSKATLIAWLKRRAAQDFGHSVVGQAVWICWCADAQFYRGTITHFNPDTGKHQVRYSDRFVEELHLPVEVLSFASEQPQVSPTSAINAARLAAAGAAASEAQAHPVDGVDIKSISVPTVGPVPHGLLHQGSGVSVNSDYKLSLADLEAFKAAEDASMDMPNLAASALQQADVEVQGSPTLAQPVLRRRAHQQQQQQQLQQGPSAATDSVNTGDSASLASGAAPLGVPKRPRTGAATRLSAGAQSAGWLQGIIGNAGAAPTLPVPPHEDASSAAMLRWLHTIALHLDDAMSSPLLMQPYVLADLEEKPLSAGACFQALLAQAPHPDVPQGYFEAMVARFHHFASSAVLQRLKLVEFMLAALHQDRQRNNAVAARSLLHAAGTALQETHIASATSAEGAV